MVTEPLISLFNRDLDKLIVEVELIDDKNLWSKLPGITNTVGNLTLHICGNLQHFIGATLGDTGYLRQRDIEFSNKNVSKHDLIDEVKQTKDVISTVLKSISEDKIPALYPLNVFDKEMSTEYFLLHLHGHLTYHLGQINYLRRAITAKTEN